MSEGRKNDSEKPGLDMLSSKALIEIAKVMDHGKRKYAKHNWRSGIVFSRLIAAVMRHILAWNDGETYDSETGISHLAHASCGLMFLLEFEQTRPDLDDRFKPETSDHEKHLKIAEKYNSTNYVGKSYEKINSELGINTQKPEYKQESLSESNMKMFKDIEDAYYGATGNKRAFVCYCGKKNCPGSQGI